MAKGAALGLLSENCQLTSLLRFLSIIAISQEEGYIRYGDDGKWQYAEYPKPYHHPTRYSPILLSAKSSEVAPVPHEHEDDNG